MRQKGFIDLDAVAALAFVIATVWVVWFWLTWVIGFLQEVK